VSFDVAAVGKAGDEHRYEVTAEALQAYADATDDVVGGPVFALLPVWSAAGQVSRAVASDDVRPKVVHYEQDIVLHRPLAPGMRVSSRATPLALLGRPNGTSLVLRTETRAEDGDLLNEQYITEFFRGVESSESVGERAPDHRLEAEEEPVAEITYPVAEDQTVRYAEASGDHFKIHLGVVADQGPFTLAQCRSQTGMCNAQYSHSTSLICLLTVTHFKTSGREKFAFRLP